MLRGEKAALSKGEGGWKRGAPHTGTHSGEWVHGNAGIDNKGMDRQPLPPHDLAPLHQDLCAETGNSTSKVGYSLWREAGASISHTARLTPPLEVEYQGAMWGVRLLQWGVLGTENGQLT